MFTIIVKALQLINPKFVKNKKPDYFDFNPAFKKVIKKSVKKSEKYLVYKKKMFIEATNKCKIENV